MRLALQSRRRPAFLALTLSVALVGGAALSAPGVPTRTGPLRDEPKLRTYLAFDAKGKQIRSKPWRVTTAGGNCCEVLVATTSSGRLLEFGGTYPAYSDNQGRTWSQVTPTLPNGPLPNGEGTIVMAPDGDVVGVGWDPYSGDRLQSFHYDSATEKWEYLEAPLHEPFYDREWIAVAKGPFTILGEEVPWVSLVVSNYHRKIVLMSTDGLHYFTPTQRHLDAVRTTRVQRALKVVRDPELDYMQPHTETSLVGLAEGGALSFDSAAVCPTQLLGRDGSWSCFQLPGGQSFGGRLLVDSRGWLHVLSSDRTAFTYRLSRDGGKTWVERMIGVRGEPQIEAYDFKVNGKLGLTAIAVHAAKPGGDHQDMVIRVDTRTGKPVHRDTLYVGKGNHPFTSGLGGAGGDRFDFATVAILPDGRIATGFGDREYQTPTVAVLAG